ncbi:hypothetical protein DTO271G3_1938 [Paecilomyces variotii]|nr:hypothetical protein DTO271G3_1938 [Paecilomyces variotii]
MQEMPERIVITGTSAGTRDLSLAAEGETIASKRRSASSPCVVPGFDPEPFALLCFPFLSFPSSSSSSLSRNCDRYLLLWLELWSFARGSPSDRRQKASNGPSASRARGQLPSIDASHLAGPGQHSKTTQALSPACCVLASRSDAKSGLLSPSTSSAHLQLPLPPFQDRPWISQKSRDR